MEIKLGDKVKDKLTGFEGITIMKTIFLNGCIQYGIVPRIKKGSNTYPEAVQIDEQSLEVIKPKQKPKPKRRNGGASRRALNMRGF